MLWARVLADAILIYTRFGLAVLAASVLAPPRRARRNEPSGPVVAIERTSGFPA